MAKMDEFREEREAIKHAPLSKRLGYFKDYYLVPVLIAAASIIFIIVLATSVLFKKEEVLYVALVNFSDLGAAEENLIKPFEEQYINTKKEEITLDSSSLISTEDEEINFVKYNYESEQKLLTLVMAGEIDLFVSGLDVIEHYEEQAWFDDLTTILDEETFKRLENEDLILYDKSVPIAVSLEGADLFTENYYYIGEQEGDVYAAFPAGPENRDLAVLFFKYLLGLSAA